MMAIVLARIVMASSTMIAADVSARNSSWGLRAQSNTMTGSDVYGPAEEVGDAAAGRERAEHGAGEDERRRLAERPG